MVHAFQLILLALLLLLALPTAVFAAQVLLAGRRRHAAKPPADARVPVAVLVPAHDEEAGIGEIVARLRSQLAAGDRLLVVADNCSDATAAIARRAGAEVAVRHDLARRGKSYALDYGIRMLAQDPREVVIIVDADCLADDGALDTLARRVQQSGRPVQALYMMYAPTRERLKSRIGEFAWLIKNLVRPLGYHRAGLPCQLMGTGMAFPWGLISKAPIASGHLVEDMKLGLDLAAAGVPPLFCPEARVWSSFPASSGEGTQRARWEHGHLGMICSEAPRAAIAALRARNLPLLALAADMAVPPLALLALLIGAAFMLSAGAWLAAGAMLAFQCAAALLVLFLVPVVVAWWRYGRQVISPWDLVLAAWYALAKIPLYQIGRAHV